MIASIFFILRITTAWLAVYLVMAIVLHETFFNHQNGGLLVLGAAIVCGVIVTGAFSHVRRVRLIAGGAIGDTFSRRQRRRMHFASLSRRQRRQIEIPLEAGEAFDLVDCAIRELPGAHDIESARDSLQVRARIKRFNPYPGDSAPWLTPSAMRTLRNQVLVTVTPNGDAGSVTLICEPERAAWTDWFLVDYGSNLENAEAMCRAIARRVAERRRGEQAAARQSATEKELTVAKLSLLHAQIEPHFLYNTLASAQLLTRSDPPRADEMLGNLITYLRHSLPRTEDALSTLGEELERARAYLDILKIRMGARLHLQVDVPEPLRAVPLPAMMLQTLVENAIKHGLEPKPGGGTVWILARAVEATGSAAPSVAVTVADDGRGFSFDVGGTGIGLRNVRERLRLAYGAAAGFAIVANFPAGVAATITVPNPASMTNTAEGRHG